MSVTSVEERSHRRRTKSDEEQMMQPISARVDEPKQVYAQAERQRSERSHEQNEWSTSEYQRDTRRGREQPGWRTSERRQSREGEYVQQVRAPPKYSHQ